MTDGLEFRANVSHRLRMWSMVGACAFPSMVLANVVWPALYLEIRLASWWAITVGLLVEYVFLRWRFKLSVGRSAFSDVVANAASAILGLILLPLAGLVWEVVPGLLVDAVVGWRTFNPASWVAACLFGSVINALVEGWVYRRWFIVDFRFGSRDFVFLVLANAVSVAVALLSLWLVPLHP